MDVDTTVRDPALLGGHPVERLAGRWSAMFVAGISVAYAAIMVAGFASLGNLSDPPPDPYLAVAEVLILLMAPVMVVLMAAVHACAPVHLRMFRRWLLTSGVLCLVGLVGPAVDVMAWRGVGILGYVVAFPIACVALSRAFAGEPAHEDLSAGRL